MQRGRAIERLPQMIRIFTDRTRGSASEEWPQRTQKDAKIERLENRLFFREIFRPKIFLPQFLKLP